MRKICAAIVLLYAVCLYADGQAILPTDSTRQLLSDLKKTIADTIRVKILTKLGSYYLYKPGEIKADLDSADLFLNQAKELSAKLKVSNIQNEVSYLKAEVLFERGDLYKARTAYLRAIDDYTRSGEMEGAAHAWFSVAVRTMYSDDSTVMRGLQGFEHAISIYTAIGDKVKEAEMRKYVGDWLLQQGKLDQAEKELLNALNLYKAVGYKKLHYTYDLLAAISNKRGDFNKTLYYSLEMMKSIQATGDTVVAYGLYLKMANIYDKLNEYEKSKYWYNRALINGAKDPRLFYAINNSLIAAMLKEGKKKEALGFLQSLVKKRPPQGPDEEEKLAERFGEIYNLLEQDELAEKYYQKAIFFAKKSLFRYTELEADKQVADFYFSRKKYALARVYLHKALAAPAGISDIELIRSSYLKLFRTDSATGNYVAAIKNYQHYQSLTDSIFTVAKAKQITMLQLQFEKDQKVNQLENKGKLQQAALQREATVRNFIFAGASLLLLFLLLFLVMVYKRYRQKQHSNRLLEAQQLEISLINQSLELTITEKETLLKEKEIILNEKDSLLAEKDWLLKEVHHRVKNNLHTVICLLESQELYLENDALEAIEICQRRIYAMSLIHQKLYQSEDIETVDMALYIKEFVQYLADSFGAPANVTIRSVVEPTRLPLSQAIPLGLILNEAVTNSFKYAFPAANAGEIFIGLKKIGLNMELIIADNGVGIQRLFEENEAPGTLGIELMRGLTADLDGNIIFETKNGTRVSVEFAVDSLARARKTGNISNKASEIYDN